MILVQKYFSCSGSINLCPSIILCSTNLKEAIVPSISPSTITQGGIFYVSNGLFSSAGTSSCGAVSLLGGISSL
jgi:hypothetical protein